LLYKYELKLTQFFVVVDKNGEFRGQQKKWRNDENGWNKTVEEIQLYLQ
jgi:hypothetical protein